MFKNSVNPRPQPLLPSRSGLVRPVCAWLTSAPRCWRPGSPRPASSRAPGSCPWVAAPPSWSAPPAGARPGWRTCPGTARPPTNQKNQRGVGSSWDRNPTKTSDGPFFLSTNSGFKRTRVPLFLGHLFRLVNLQNSVFSLFKLAPEPG